MEMVIKKMTLDNFKGAKHLELDLDGERILLKGRNGSFKTTCADAFYHVFCGCNTQLIKNPFITPLGEDEVVSRVEMEIEIDGRPCQVSKIQKFKRKTDEDGRTTSSTTNTYEVNGVSKTERDFIADMTERGLDMENFLIYSNPDAFFADTSKKGRDELRKVLFKMAEETSDEEIADEIHAVDVKALLEKGYKLDEVEYMNKATIRKITETYGKSGELVDAKIEGLLSSIEDVDIPALTEQKNNLESKMNEIDSQINGSSDRTTALKKRLMEIDVEIKDIERKANKDIQEAISNKDHEISAVESKLKITNSRAEIVTNEINSTNNSIKRYESQLNECRDKYKVIQDEVFDEESKKCPTCGRIYEESKVEQIKADFEKSKSERLANCKKDGEEIKTKIQELKKSLGEIENEFTELMVQITSLTIEFDNLTKEMASMPTKADISKDEGFKKLMAETEELTRKIENTITDSTSKLVDERAEVKAELDKVIARLGIVDHNKKVNEKISELRESKMASEINKANAEKIINQVDEIKKAKNERLGASINSHFNIVSFKLWDLKKNGTYDDVVDLMIDGKPASSCANGSLLVLSKLDCLAGLQNFFNQHIPVFMDDASLLTENTRERIKLDSQLILLMAMDGVSELTIEKEE